MAIAGVLVAVLTPFRPRDLSVDTEELENHVRFLMEHRVDGLFTCGTAGEGLLLSAEERKFVLASVLGACSGRLPVVAHVGHIDPQIACELADHAKHAGAAAVASVPPYYFPLDDEALLTYFEAVARAASPLPFYVYNYPETTNNTVSAALLETLIERIPNLEGVKDSSKHLDRFTEFLRAGPHLKAIVGSDALILASLRAGGAGVISTVANVFPDAVVALHRAWRSGDPGRAERLQQLVDEMRRSLKDGPYISMYKAALALRGRRAAAVRPPLRELTAGEWERLREALGKLERLREKAMS